MINQFLQRTVLFLLCGFGSPLCAAVAAAQPLDDCNVVWNTLGVSSADAMPVGNGDIGLNVWTGQNGDLLLYIGKTDSWGEDISENPELYAAGQM